MNPGKTATIYDIPKIVNIALLQAAPKNILRGFDNLAYSQADSNKEVCLPYSIQLKPANKRFKESIQIAANQVDTRIKDTFISNKISDHRPNTPLVFKISPPLVFIIPPESIRPLPKTDPRLASKRGKKKRSTMILTSSPIKLLMLANDC